MNSIMKKALFVVAFVLVTLVIPAIILLLFVDASTSFSFYVIVYGVILFGIFGYVVVSVRGMEKQLNNALEEIKMQNAAIAYKLSGGTIDLPKAPNPVVQEQMPEPADSTERVNLNPADPLIMPEVKKPEKVADDGFDDFK